MGQGTITVLDPVARVSTRELPLALRTHDLQGKVLGLLWNSKPNGDILLHRLQEKIVERLGLAGSIWQQKTRVEIPGTEAIKELSLNAHFVINGPGD